MSCSKCKSKLPCGCDDQSLESGVVCNTEACPNPDECPETFSAACTVWTGNDLVCNSSVVATAGMRLDAVIENMVALFCGPQTPPQQDMNLLHPFVNELLTGTDNHIICVDRINCFEDIVLSFDVLAPAGILFADAGGGTPTITMTSDLSCIHFDVDISGAAGSGVQNFNILVTGCGDVLTVPIQITLP